MAEVEKVNENKIIVFCDCGEVHTITAEGNELKIITRYKKQEKEKEDKEKKEKKNEKEERRGIFNW